jgi:hypothetical protein
VHILLGQTVKDGAKMVIKGETVNVMTMAICVWALTLHLSQSNLPVIDSNWAIGVLVCSDK